MLKSIQFKIVISFLLVGLIFIVSLGITNLYNNIGFYGTLFLILGGVMYSIGAVLYSLGSHKRYMHSVFHFFCIAGTLFHFLCVYLCIL